MQFQSKHAKVNPRCLVNTVDFHLRKRSFRNFPYIHLFSITYELSGIFNNDPYTAFSAYRDRCHFRHSFLYQNNGTHYDGLVLLHPKKNVSPAIYLMPYYHRYLEGVCLEEICEDILHTYQAHAPEENFDTSYFTDFSRASEHIVMRLVSFEKIRNC